MFSCFLFRCCFFFKSFQHGTKHTNGEYHHCFLLHQYQNWCASIWQSQSKTGNYHGKNASNDNDAHNFACALQEKFKYGFLLAFHLFKSFSCQSSKRPNSVFANIKKKKRRIELRHIQIVFSLYGPLVHFIFHFYFTSTHFDVSLWIGVYRVETLEKKERRKKITTANSDVYIVHYDTGKKSS